MVSYCLRITDINPLEYNLPFERFLNPDRASVYSWWSYKDQARQKNNGWRIDYICASKNLIKNLKSCEVMMDTHGSDHCPVQAVFEF